MRYCSREFKKEDPNREDLFTPANTVSTERMIDIHANKLGNIRVIVDCKNAYLHAAEDEAVVCKPADIWLEKWIAGGGRPDILWRLRKQMYGRRKASQSFNDYMARVLGSLELEQFCGATQFWINRAKQTLIDLHQDDLHCSIPETCYDWLVESLKK